ncbi:precorrin-6A reductase [Butyrivibrio sp. NC2007]|uniref:precorrin-6A reductase n=1 Tax=Butyrivibrio sp. NC2007 TaxID=1280683 RepID=UPI0003B2E2E5|nr:precorrin-6A reductase [Butyrivibrio sp. NC2007]
MRDKILVFGGTTEGRLLASKLEELGIPHVVSVATEYGKTVEEESGEASLLVGRMDRNAIADLLRSGEFAAVVDATHPYAIKASKEIKSACEKESFTYLRLLRKTADSEANEENVTYVEDVAEAAKELEKRAGNILLLTGSRDLKEITSGISDISRVYVRIIPDVASIEKCHEAGLRGRQIIAMQGPFSVAMNEALIREINASVILTKESGEAGGFSEKLRAADNCNAQTIVIRNPEKNDISNDGLEAGEILNRILAILGKEPLEEPCRRITLGGVGPGDERFYTAEFSKAMKEADIVFGAKTVLERIKGISAPQKDWYEGEKIMEFLKEHHEYKAPLVVYSGDISLCSGAKKASAIFEEEGYTVKKISGISSVSLFAARLGAALEDVTIISNHGRECDVGGFVRKNEKVILLANSAEAALETAKRLPKECRVIFGCELGTEAEKISEYGAEGFLESDVKGKTLMYIENPEASKNKLIPALSDDEIIRGDVPMTKEEVRALSVRKLRLTKNSVLYDVGAGTGSISLEAALTDPGVKVFSIEKNKKAIELLYKNRDKFGLGNMEIVEGKAPEALAGLTKPSHVFIGGSSGNLEEIIKSCMKDNGPVRFVVNCVTLETLGKTMEVISAMGAANTEVVQLSAARFKEVGTYHMADGMNPVFVIAFEV